MHTPLVKRLSRVIAPLLVFSGLAALVACAGRLPIATFHTLIGDMAERTTAAFPAYVDCRRTFGEPARVTGTGVSADPQWVADNLVTVRLPWKAHAAWDATLPIRTLQVHRLAAPSLERALDRIWTEAGQSQTEIRRLGLDAVGGGYNFRPIRTSQGASGRLSTHAYGCAVDFDPARNALGDAEPNLALPENRYVIDAFRAEGWVWGGHWPQPDGMHFQAARLPAEDSRKDTASGR